MSVLAGKSIILDGQVIHGRDHFGDWRVNTLDGWDDTPPPKGESVEREGADGEFDLPVQYAARTITLAGRLLAASPAGAANARARLNGRLPGRVGRVQVTGLDRATLWADVKRNGPSTGKITGSILRFTFELKAPNPRKFGDVRRYTLPASETVQAFHRGNYAAWPEFRVTGNMPDGYRLVVNGKTFTVTRGITSGSHTVDYRDGRLRVNSSYVAGGVGSAALAPIPPGLAVPVRLEPVTGTGSATATVYDTFI